MYSELDKQREIEYLKFKNEQLLSDLDAHSEIHKVCSTEVMLTGIFSTLFGVFIGYMLRLF